MDFMYRETIMSPTFQSARSAGVGRPEREAYMFLILGTARSSCAAPVGEKRFTSETSLLRSAWRRNPGLPRSTWKVPSGSYLTVSSGSPRSSRIAANGLSALIVVRPAKKLGPVSNRNSPASVLRLNPCAAPPTA